MGTWVGKLMGFLELVKGYLKGFNLAPSPTRHHFTTRVFRNKGTSHRTAIGGGGIDLPRLDVGPQMGGFVPQTQVLM